MLEFIRDDHFDLFRKLMDKHRRGTHKGIRLITSIDSHTINAIEDLISIGVEVKHIPKLDSKQFVVSDVAAHIRALDYRLNLILHRLIPIMIFLKAFGDQRLMQVNE